MARKNGQNHVLYFSHFFGSVLIVFNPYFAHVNRKTQAHYSGIPLPRGKYELFTSQRSFLQNLHFERGIQVR